MAASKVLQRQEYILTYLTAHQEASARELAERLNVSIWTIRRDLAELEAHRALDRRYGGAQAAGLDGSPFPHIERDTFRDAADLNLEAKRRIGQTTARLVRTGQRLAIGGGTTTLEAARALKAVRFKGEVITNSLDVALELAEEPELHVVCTGGDIQPRYHTLVGSVTERMLKQHFFDVAIIGISGIATRYGITVNSQVDATYLEIMIEHSHRAIAVADRSKFGRVGFVSLSPEAQIHDLITDEAPAAEFLQDLDARQIHLMIAD